MREELLVNTISLLQGHGFSVSSFVHMNSCFDLVAKRNDLSLLIKVFSNIDALRPEQAKELSQLGKIFKANELIVGEKTKAFSLSKGIVYERHGIPVVSFSTLEAFLSKEIPSVKCFKGKMVVEIDSEKLREKRKELNLSLEELAKKASFAKESIYRYEHGARASLEAAEVLERILGSPLIEKKEGFHDFFNDFKKDIKLEPNEMFHDRALERMHDLGLKLSVFEHAPFKAFADQKESLFLSRALGGKELERKAMVLEKTKAVMDSHSLIVTKKYKLKKVHQTPLIEEKELDSMSKPKELMRLVKKREKL